MAHDSLGVNQDGFCKVGKVTIGNRVSVGYGSIIHPGVVIEDGAIVAAGSCVVSGTVIKSGEVFGGSPATKIGTVEAYMEKRRFRYRGRDIEVAASRGIRILKGDTANRADLAEKLHPGETLLIPHTGRYSINAEGEENG